MDGRLPGDREVTGRQNPAYRPARLPLPLPFGGSGSLSPGPGRLRLGSRRGRGCPRGGIVRVGGYPAGYLPRLGRCPWGSAPDPAPQSPAGLVVWGGAPPDCLLGSRGAPDRGGARWCALVLRGHSAVSPPHGRLRQSPADTPRIDRIPRGACPTRAERGRGGVSPQDEARPPSTTAMARTRRAEETPLPGTATGPHGARTPTRPTDTGQAQPNPAPPAIEARGLGQSPSTPPPPRSAGLTAGARCRSGGGPRRCRPRSRPPPRGTPPRVPCGRGTPAGRRGRGGPGS